MWQEKEVDEKKDYVVGNVNKQEITDFFVDAVVVYPDRKNGVFRQVERVERAIRNLVQVDPSSQEFDGLTDVV